MKEPCKTTTKQVAARVYLFHFPAVSGRNPNAGLPYIDPVRAKEGEADKQT